MRHILLLLFVFAAQTTYAATLFREDFNDLESWEPLHFEKIKRHSTYTIESNGGEKYVVAKSQASASGMVYKAEFDVYKYPWVKWRWRIKNVYRKGDAATKSGDDYPIRIYIMFKYDPQKADFLDRVTYGALKLIYDEYPPHSSLNYIWANKTHKKNIIVSPYTNKAMMIPLQEGNVNAGKWMSQEVNIIEDYRKAFGKTPPSVAKIAIMNDSDNTGEASVSYVDYIQVYSK